jgi:trimethylamine--corrinoid protein Co-methyltransferase
MSLWASVLAGGNVIQHAFGWLEGGLVASFEKMIIDAEMLQMFSQILQPMTIDGVDSAIEAIREVGPGGHFFGVGHTLSRYENAFYPPLVSDWRNFESWQEAGSPDTAQRANAIYKTLLKDYVAPPIYPDISEELDSYVEQRKAEIGTSSVD